MSPVYIERRWGKTPELLDKDLNVEESIEIPPGQTYLIEGELADLRISCNLPDNGGKVKLYALKPDSEIYAARFFTLFPHTPAAVRSNGSITIRAFDKLKRIEVFNIHHAKPGSLTKTGKRKR